MRNLSWVKFILWFCYWKSTCPRPTCQCARGIGRGPFWNSWDLEFRLGQIHPAAGLWPGPSQPWGGQFIGTPHAGGQTAGHPCAGKKKPYWNPGNLRGASRSPGGRGARSTSSPLRPGKWAPANFLGAVLGFARARTKGNYFHLGKRKSLIGPHPAGQLEPPGGQQNN